MKSKKIIPWTTLLIFAMFTIIVFTVKIPSDDQIVKIVTTTINS